MQRAFNVHTEMFEVSFRTKKKMCCRQIFKYIQDLNNACRSFDIYPGIKISICKFI